MNPLVSIVIPGYNAGEYLDRCVKSIINQTYKNLEIILVDDGSFDDTLDKFYQYAKMDNRVKVLHRENGGLALARNMGLAAVSGDYVMFADSDDYLEEDMVEFLLNLALQYDADVARCGFYYESDANALNSASNDESIHILDYDERMIDLAVGGYLSGVVWNKLYRFQIIKDQLYSKEDGCSEDIMFNYRVYRQVKRTAFCDVPKYHYVIREGSITNSAFTENAFSIVRAKQIMIDGEKSNERILPYVIKGYVISAFVVLSGCISNNACMHRYDALRNSILQYKKDILTSRLYSGRDKLKTLLLWSSPRLYNKLIRLKG